MIRDRSAHLLRIHPWQVALVVFVCCGCTKVNPLFCDQETPCADGFRCNERFSCEPIDGGSDGPALDASLDEDMYDMPADLTTDVAPSNPCSGAVEATACGCNVEISCPEGLGCDLSTGTCFAACSTHEGCEPASLCDLRFAHLRGRGFCVPPRRIIDTGKAPLAKPLKDSFSELLTTDGKTHLKLSADEYAGFSIGAAAQGAEVTLVGIDLPAIRAKDSDHVLYVGPQAGNLRLTLQGVRITGGRGVTPWYGAGLFCDRPSPIARIKVIDSLVDDNYGVGVISALCGLELRRNRIRDNSRGGITVSPADAPVTIVNNRIVQNGLPPVEQEDFSPDHAEAGLVIYSPIESTEPTIRVAYNTVAVNRGGTDFVGGIVCNFDAPAAVDIDATVLNSIVEFNFNAAMEIGSDFNGCRFRGSSVPDLGVEPGDGNVPGGCFDFFPQTVLKECGCFDAGVDLSTWTVLDRLRRLRPRGAGPDCGTLEEE